MTKNFTVKGLTGGVFNHAFMVDKLIDEAIITGVYKMELHDSASDYEFIDWDNFNLYEVFTDPSGAGYPTDIEYIATYSERLDTLSDYYEGLSCYCG